MIDFSSLPKPQNGTIDYFLPNALTAGSNWTTWNKPKNCTFVRILCIGAGGGGGGGGSANGGGTAAGGGGGGASGAIAVTTMPAIFLPNVLYVSAGIGGKGANTTGLAGFVVNGNAGAPSEVCIAPSNTAIYIICYANSGTGGNGGTTSGGGVGGTGGGLSVLATANQGFQGHFTSIAGQNGATGSTSTGNSITYPTTGILLSGGASGGAILSNTSYVGGSVNAPASQNSTYNLFQTRTALAYTDGPDGMELSIPLMSCGGGGGGAFTGGGNKGGNAGFGSGGGGGGGSVASGAVGGPGGNGGHGLVVIQTW